jgi:hypothetical protein
VSATELKESLVGEDKTMYIPIAIGERADDLRESIEVRTLVFFPLAA